ncbi:MAG: hypothetical protein ACRC33_09580 [Gemmataceae bacterium]
MSGAFASVFTEINLPNPATWVYFSGLLAVALFFKFGRVFSLRNLDVLTLFAFAPGLLLISEGGRAAFYGYMALLIASAYFLVRCLFDLALTRRPALGPNLDFAGLAWLAGTLYLSLIAVTARQPAPYYPRPEPRTPIEKLPEVGAKVIDPNETADRPRLGLVVERVLTLACHLSVVVGLVLVGGLVFESVSTGMSAATFYLLLPYTFLLVPDSPLGVGRWDHPWPMAFMVWSVLCYRRPILAGMFLGAAAGTAVFLVVVLPAWLSFYGPRGASRFLTSFVLSASIGLALLASLFWLNGELPAGLQTPWTTFDWQPWKKPAEGTGGFWQGTGLARGMAAYRVPVFVVAMSLVLFFAFWPRPKNLAHVLALSAACLISIQFWYADRGGVYVLWYLPLLLLVVFRPNLEEKLPAEPPADDVPARVAGFLGWLLGLLLRLVTSPGRAKVKTGG